MGYFDSCMDIYHQTRSLDFEGNGYVKVFLVGHLGEHNVSKSLALESCSLYGPLQNFIFFRILWELSLSWENIMSYLYSKVRYIFHVPGVIGAALSCTGRWCNCTFKNFEFSKFWPNLKEEMFVNSSQALAIRSLYFIKFSPMTSFVHEHIGSWNVCLCLIIKQKTKTANSGLFYFAKVVSNTPCSPLAKSATATSNAYAYA